MGGSEGRKVAVVGGRVESGGSSPLPIPSRLPASGASQPHQVLERGREGAGGRGEGGGEGGREGGEGGREGERGGEVSLGMMC